MKEKRDRWGSKREKQRIKARFDIKERVTSLVTANIDSTTTGNQQIADECMFRTVQGMKSFFSISFVNQNIGMLSNPLPVVPTFMREDGSIKMGQEILSRFGAEVTRRLHVLLFKRDAFTLYEYATWLGRDEIVLNLVQGGVVPSKAECFFKKCFLDSVPYSLAQYIVSSIMNMKTAAMLKTVPVGKLSCDVCLEAASLVNLGSCEHLFCEACMWKHATTVCLCDYESDDILSCPACFNETSRQCDHVHFDCPSLREQRSKESLSRFLSLPKDVNELKRKTSKRSVSKEAVPSRSWKAALLPTIGKVQPFRTEKLLKYVELGLYAHVKTCLEAGVDVSVVDEYGHGLAFIATWYNLSSVLNLLLKYGCNGDLSSNAGYSALQLARWNRNQTIEEMLLACQFRECGMPDQFTVETPDAPTTHILIPPESQHPGAGSFYIEQAVSDTFVRDLQLLHSHLPIAAKTKLKTGPCSVRRYFCDVFGSVLATLEGVISYCVPTETPPVVFPHMRFLNYEVQGVDLSSHTDLSRNHPFKDIRSTHTFLLYLTTCDEGGETSLLQDLQSETILCQSSPTSRRLLLFPHDCPHSGEVVVCVPKLLLRGEVFLPLTQKSKEQ